MNKSELIGEFAKRLETTQKQAEKNLHTLLTIISEQLKKGEAVTLIGFGNFTVKARAAREARNPRSGEIIKVPATVVPHFAAGKALKDAVKNTKVKEKK